jgi:hypothetical protein
MEGGLPDYFRCFSQELLATRISRMLKNNTYLDALPLRFWKAGVQFTTFEKCKVRIKFFPATSFGDPGSYSNPNDHSR